MVVRLELICLPRAWSREAESLTSRQLKGGLGSQAAALRTQGRGRSGSSTPLGQPHQSKAWGPSLANDAMTPGCVGDKGEGNVRGLISFRGLTRVLHMSLTSSTGEVTEPEITTAGAQNHWATATPGCCGWVQRAKDIRSTNPG